MYYSDNKCIIMVTTIMVIIYKIFLFYKNMSDLKNYITNDLVADNSEISIQISNGIIILFPILSLCCIKILDKKYRASFIALLFVIIVTGALSVTYHMHDESSSNSNTFKYLDTTGVVIIWLISFLIIFDVIFKNPQHKSVKIKLLYRVFYIFTSLFMVALYAVGNIYDNKKANKLTEKQSKNIHNTYHNMWHMSGAILIVITILYAFTFHEKPPV